MYIRGEAYDFPSRVFTRVDPNNYHADELVLSYLKKLILKRVNVTKENFHNFLKNSPNLEMISINNPVYLDHIIIGGRGQCRNLKYFEIVDTCNNVKSIYLSDLDLVSFTFKGYTTYTIDLRLALLTKLKEFEVDIDGGLLNINNVYSQIFSCALSPESLSIAVKNPQGSLILESVSMLPNLKKLRLAVGGSGYDCLLFVASIMNSCPKL
ncbi:uncharacterized protein [Rutidosis leptorrhynchoides]|uniref:uncharacterized protein n=1 Tax=Rutidosis leptorrhynchoides TaxID=125765 RepID=UPI003A99C696